VLQAFIGGRPHYLADITANEGIGRRSKPLRSHLVHKTKAHFRVDIGNPRWNIIRDQQRSPRLIVQFLLEGGSFPHQIQLVGTATQHDVQGGGARRPLQVVVHPGPVGGQGGVEFTRRRDNDADHIRAGIQQFSQKIAATGVRETGVDERDIRRETGRNGQRRLHVIAPYDREAATGQHAMQRLRRQPQQRHGRRHPVLIERRIPGLIRTAP